MNIQQIEYVLAVNKLRSFGKAADSCFVTQSTLSTMIVRLEEEISITIFNRKTRPISVTKEGKEIIEQLSSVSSALSEFDELVTNLKGGFRGTLKIGVIPTVASYIFPHFLTSFILEYPAISFEISEIPTDKIIESIINREIEIGITSIPLENNNLIEIPLYTEPFLLYDTNSTTDKDEIDFNDIALDRLWLLEEGHCLRSQAERVCNIKEKNSVKGNLIYKSATIETLIGFVDKQNGLTILPELAARNVKNPSFLNSFKAPTPARLIGIVTHTNFIKKKILHNLGNAIKEKIVPLLSVHKNHKIISPLG